jgi:type 1 glutamine amidotransferase
MSKTNLRTLVLCDDTWHPAAVVRRGLAAFSDDGFAFEFLEDGSKWSAAMMGDFSLVVLAKANITSSIAAQPWLAADSQEAFPNFVRRGNGLVVVHAGTCRYESAPATCELIGGRFLHHPEQCAVTVSPTPGRALTVGVSPFTLRDEHYFIAMSDPSAKVFLHSRSEHGEQPAGWTRSHGEGRVCVLTPGHNQEVWLYPSFQKLLSNALKWAAKKV